MLGIREEDFQFVKKVAEKITKLEGYGISIRISGEIMFLENGIRHVKPLKWKHIWNSPLKKCQGGENN